MNCEDCAVLRKALDDIQLRRARQYGYLAGLIHGVIVAFIVLLVMYQLMAQL